MKHLAYDNKTGDFVGWYDSNLTMNIPSPNIAVTDEEYVVYYEMMSQQDLRPVVADGKITFVSTAYVITWDDIRYKRDMKLSKTDWTQGRDVPEAVYSKYMSYRQALRDVPQNFPTPESVVWPNPADYGI